MYTQGAAAYKFVRVLVEASNLPISEVRHFLDWKPPFIKFTVATR